VHDATAAKLIYSYLRGTKKVTDTELNNFKKISREQGGRELEQIVRKSRMESSIEKSADALDEVQHACGARNWPYANLDRDSKPVCENVRFGSCSD